jgi:hypothetical protein
LLMLESLAKVEINVTNWRKSKGAWNIFRKW